MCVLSCFSPVWLFATPWMVAHQAPLSVGFSRHEYWSGLPFSYSRGSSWHRDWTCVSILNSPPSSSLQDGEHMYTCGGFILIFIKLIKKKKKNLCLLCFLHWEVSSLPLMPRWKLYWPTLGLNSKCFQGCIPSGGPKEESVPCLFQIPEATPISWPVGLSLSSKPATLGWVFFKMPSLQFPTARILLLFSH